MKQRLQYIIYGILIFMCCGAIYSWSVFRKPLEELFSITSTESGLPFMVFLAVYAVTMPLAGKYIEKLGPRTMIFLGGMFVSCGWLAASFAHNISMITLTYGVIGGFGVGIAYGAPLTVSGRWFPDKKGFAMGLTLLGFGFSPFVTAPLARYLIASYGPMAAFRILGVAFFAVISLLSIPMRFPRKSEITDVQSDALLLDMPADKTPRQMFKTRQFVGLWLCYVIGAFTGLTAIGITSPVAQEIVKLDAQTAAFMVSLFAIFNGIGRPIFGTLTDKLGAANAALISFVAIIGASLVMLTAGEGHVVLYTLSFAAFWMMLGGWLSIAPAATASLFGKKYYAQNYGFVFTAYGCAAILGVLLSGKIKTHFGSYINTFYITIAMAVLGIVVSRLTLRSPVKNDDIGQDEALQENLVEATVNAS